MKTQIKKSLCCLTLPIILSACNAQDLENLTPEQRAQLDSVLNQGSTEVVQVSSNPAPAPLPTPTSDQPPVMDSNPVDVTNNQDDNIDVADTQMANPDNIDSQNADPVMTGPTPNNDIVTTLITDIESDDDALQPDTTITTVDDSEVDNSDTDNTEITDNEVADNEVADNEVKDNEVVDVNTETTEIENIDDTIETETVSTNNEDTDDASQTDPEIADQPESFSIAASTPVNNAINRALVSVLEVDFGTPVFATTINNTTVQLVSNNQQTDITLSYTQGDTNAKVTPNNRLKPNTEYSLILNSDIMAQSGQTLSATTIRFTTAGNIGSTSQSVVDNCMDENQLEMLHQVNTVRMQSYTCVEQADKQSPLISTFYPSVAPMSFSCQLGEAAERHSRDMALNHFLNHTGSDGSNARSRIADTGYRFSSWAENIAFRTDDSIDSVMNQWLTSKSGHCRNIMNAQRDEIGLAKFTSIEPTPGRNPNLIRRYWTQVFAKSK